MSDPLDRLREDTSALSSPAPDVESIKMRARQIDSRRRLTWAAVAGSIMTGLVVVAAVLALKIHTPIPVGDEPIPAVIAGAPTDTPGTITAPTQAPGGGRQSGLEPPGSGVRRTGPLRVELEVEPATVKPGGTATLRLSACNVTQAQVRREFTSGQRYDFEVRRGRDLVWRWGSNRLFEQSAGQEVWQPRECRSFEESWTTTRFPAGAYTAIGTITSTEPARSGDVRVCVGSC